MCSKILRPLLGYANFVDSASVPTKVSICLYMCHIRLHKRTVTTIQGHALKTKTD
jgi:hypothetical protein